MAFISIGNEKGITIECVVFPRVFEIYKELLLQDTVIILEGKLDIKNEKPVIIVDRIFHPENYSA